MKKIYRLKKNHEIASIVKKRQRVYSNHYIIYYNNKSYNQPNQLASIAISVSKKYGSAVERNYAKRVVREIIRPQIKCLNNLSLVIVIKNDAKGASFVDLNEDLLKLIKRVIFLYNKEKKTLEGVN